MLGDHDPAKAADHDIDDLHVLVVLEGPVRLRHDWHKGCRLDMECLQLGIAALADVWVLVLVGKMPPQGSWPLAPHWLSSTASVNFTAAVNVAQQQCLLHGVTPVDRFGAGARRPYLSFSFFSKGQRGAHVCELEGELQEEEDGRHQHSHVQAHHDDLARSAAALRSEGWHVPESITQTTTSLSC